MATPRKTAPNGAAQSAFPALPAGFRAGWDQIEAVMRRTKVPDRIPLMEIGFDPGHKERMLGRPVKNLQDTIEFAKRVGQSFVVISRGLHTEPVVRMAMSAAGTEDSDAHAESAELHIDAVDSKSWKNDDQRLWVDATAAVIKSEADIDAFPWPNPADIDLSILDETDRLLPPEMKVFFVEGKVFNLGWWLMGFDAYSLAIYDEPRLIRRLHEKIAEIQFEVLKRALKHPSVGLVWHPDDLAYRTGLMVSPQFLREQIFPVYKEMNALCAARGVLTCFHSDGDNREVMEDVIAAGFDGFNPVEPVAMDIRALQKSLGDRLSLIGNVDLAYTLTLGTPAEVDAEVRDLIRDLGGKPGYALASANSVPDYVPWENVVAFHRAWLAYSRVG